MITLLYIVGAALVIALAIIAQYRKVMMEKLLEYALHQEQWIDDIIKALEKDDEDEGDVDIDYLIDAKRTLGKGPLD